MRNIDPQDMIEWLGQELSNCKKSIQYYTDHPEKDKAGERRIMYMHEIEWIEGRIVVWQSMKGQ